MTAYIQAGKLYLIFIYTTASHSYVFFYLFSLFLTFDLDETQRKQQPIASHVNRGSRLYQAVMAVIALRYKSLPTSPFCAF
jgi:hypothetical protein